jgi:hypothetical protein
MLFEKTGKIYDVGVNFRLILSYDIYHYLGNATQAGRRIPGFTAIKM